MEVSQHLRLLLRQQLEVEGEDHEVGEEGVEVAAQAQLLHLAVVGVVHMGQHLQQPPVDALHTVLQAGRELLTCTHSKHTLV
jgi:hypothetical protein